MSDLKRVDVKDRFVLHHNLYHLKDGRTTTDLSMVLPGENFEVYYIPQEYEDREDPEAAMREEAEKQFIYMITRN